MCLVSRRLETRTSWLILDAFMSCLVSSLVALCLVLALSHDRLDVTQLKSYFAHDTRVVHYSFVKFVETRRTIADIRPRPTRPRANTRSRSHSRCSHFTLRHNGSAAIRWRFHVWSCGRQLQAELATVCINTSTCHTEKLAKLHRSRLWGQSGSIQTLCWSAQYSGSVTWRPRGSLRHRDDVASGQALSGSHDEPEAVQTDAVVRRRMPCFPSTSEGGWATIPKSTSRRWQDVVANTVEVTSSSVRAEEQVVLTHQDRRQ